MERREFLKKAGLGTATAVAAIAIGAPAVLAQKNYSFKMVSTWPANFPVLQVGLDLFAKRVEEATEGRVKIQVFAAGELVPAMETFQVVSDGTVEMGSGAAYYWAGKVRAAQTNLWELSEFEAHNGEYLEKIVTDSRLFQTSDRPFVFLSAFSLSAPGGHDQIEIAGCNRLIATLSHPNQNWPLLILVIL